MDTNDESHEKKPGGLQGRPRDPNDWSQAKRSYYRRCLRGHAEWKLQDACVLLVPEDEFPIVEQLLRTKNADELADGLQDHTPSSLAERPRVSESLPVALGIPPHHPASVNRLGAIVEVAKGAIQAKKLKLSRKDKKTGEPYVKPAPFLRWANNSGCPVPSDVLKENDTQFERVPGTGYTKNESLFLEHLVAALMIEREECKFASSEKVSVERLVAEVMHQNQDQYWPSELGPMPDDLGQWVRLARGFLRTYHNLISD